MRRGRFLGWRRSKGRPFDSRCPYRPGSQELFRTAANRSYQMSDLEAASFLPFFMLKVSVVDTGSASFFTQTALLLCKRLILVCPLSSVATKLRRSARTRRRFCALWSTSTPPASCLSTLWMYVARGALGTRQELPLCPADALCPARPALPATGSQGEERAPARDLPH